MSASKEVKKDKMGDDPPYLTVGTDVSAKYKGAFCEAKVRKVVRTVKCKVSLKHGGSIFVTDDLIRGNLRIGGPVEVKHPDKKEYVEGIITSTKDSSQYTVVFDDGDITTLRRTALCLKSGRHFAESETLDQLPLTHPEHFSTPVIGGSSRRGRRRVENSESSSEDDEDSNKEKQKEADIGKVVCVEGTDNKKKQKDNWFPGLIVAPTAQRAVRIDVDEDYLVRSFTDSRYYTVPKKEATEFTREIGLKAHSSLKPSVDLALLFLDKDELPNNWDREILFGLVESEMDDDSDQFDSESSDDEPREEKDHFVAQLYKFMDDRGTPINKAPIIASKDVDLYRLFRVVFKLGGYNRVTNHNQWKLVSHKLAFGQTMTTVNLIKHAYKKFLHGFEDFYRKLGCTMVNHPRSNRTSKTKSNRSLIRDKDRSTPVNKESDRIKYEPSTSSSVDSNKDEKEPKTEIKRDDEEIKKDKILRKDEDIRKDKAKREDDARKERINKREEEVRKEKEKQKEEIKKTVKRNEDNFKKEKIKQKDEKHSKKEVDDKKDKEKEDQLMLAAASKKKLEDAFKVKDKIKTEDKSKSTIGILAKFSYKKDKTKLEKVDEKDRLNKVKKTLQMKGPGGMMERQKRTIKDTVKAFAKSLGIGGKSLSSGTGTSTRKMSVSGGIVENEEERKKKVQEETTTIVSVQKKRVSSTTTPTPGNKSKEEITVSSTIVSPPSQIKLRKSSTSGESSSTVRGGSSNKKSSDEDVLSPESKKSSRINHRNKKKDDDELSSLSETSDAVVLDVVAPHKSISIGDKLKVYYGPNHKSKVTYEAKVLNTREENGAEIEYFVHYTGWNVRYDEWIRRNRIAENLSWTPSRSSKRISGTKPSAGTVVDTLTQALVRPVSPDTSGTPTTPSSSSASKPKPIIRSPSSRNLNKAPTRPSTRSARTNTDDSDSSKESDSEESEAEVESESSGRTMRSRRIRSDILSDEDKKSVSPSKRHKKSRAGEEGDDEDEGEEDKLSDKVKIKEDDKSDQQDEAEKKTPLQEVERKSLRLSQRKNKEMEIEKRLGPESDSDSEDMKAKVLEIIEPKEESLDDVYEFKEPEPFDFKSKKTISPPRRKEHKLSIGLFEDYDNTDEDIENPISAAIQRAIGLDGKNTNKESLSSESNNSSESDSNSFDQSESFSMMQDMKKRAQNEWKTYEGPKSEMKKECVLESTSPVRTRKSSESSNDASKSKKPEVSVESLKVPQKVEDSDKSDATLDGTKILKPKLPKSDNESSKSKKNEGDSELTKRTSKDCSNVETLKREMKTRHKAETSESQAPENTKIKAETRTESPGSKTRSRTELKKQGDIKSSEVEKQKVENCSSEEPIKSKLESILTSKLKSKPEVVKTVDSKSHSSETVEKGTESKDDEVVMKDQITTSNKTSSESVVKVIPKLCSVSDMRSFMEKKALSLKSESLGKSLTEHFSSKLDETISSVAKGKGKMGTDISSTNKKLDPVQSEKPPTSPQGIKLDSSKVKLKSKVTPTTYKTISGKPVPTSTSEAQKSKSKLEIPLLLNSSIQTVVSISHLQGSIKTFADVKTIKKDKITASALTKLQKVETSFVSMKKEMIENRSADIPVLQKIEAIIPKTPIKLETIDPSKIDLIKISPSMPQLEKIDVAACANITPLKNEEIINTIEGLPKNISFNLDNSCTSTPEKLPSQTEQKIGGVKASDSKNESPSPNTKLDKKIEFKMKPKSASPSLGFDSAKRARKVVRPKLEGLSPIKKIEPDEKEAASPDLAKSKLKLGKSPLQSVLKKYGNDSKSISGVDVSPNKPTVKSTIEDTIMQVATGQVGLKPEDEEKRVERNEKTTTKEDISNTETSNKNKILNETPNKGGGFLNFMKKQVSKLENIRHSPLKKIETIERKQEEIKEKKIDLFKNEPVQKIVNTEEAKTSNFEKKTDITKQVESNEKDNELHNLDNILLKDEKSKELSSVFEFDESLEDEIVDIESDSYILKRKFQQLESPDANNSNAEFIKNKKEKLDELEKLKQKLFMDSSGENDDLVIDTDEPTLNEEKSATEIEKDANELKVEDKDTISVNVKENSVDTDSGEISLKADECLEDDEDEEEEVDNALLCKETIPGSPTPYQDDLNMIMELPSTSGVIAVMDNTPPTTPDSSLSSPRDESSPASEEKGDNDSRTPGAVYTKILSSNESPRKMGLKRRSSQTERNLKKRIKQSPRNTAGSDSDDLSESYSLLSSPSLDLNNKSKFSYFMDLDPELDQSQRIAVLQQKLQDLRKEYIMYKQELVCIDRRRKKIRRRERENKRNIMSEISSNTSPPIVTS